MNELAAIVSGLILFLAGAGAAVCALWIIERWVKR